MSDNISLSIGFGAVALMMWAGMVETRRRYQFVMSAISFLAVSFLVHANANRDPNKSYTLFSNDAPLGSSSQAAARIPDIYYGVWNDLNSLGVEAPGPSPFNVSSGFRTILWYTPAFFGTVYGADFMLLCAWVFLWWGLIAPVSLFKTIRATWFVVLTVWFVVAIWIACRQFDDKYEALRSLFSLGGILFITGLGIVMAKWGMEEAKEFE